MAKKKSKKAKKPARYPGGSRYTPPAPRPLWHEWALGMFEANAVDCCPLCAATAEDDEESELEACPGMLAEFPDGTVECSEGDGCLGAGAFHVAGAWAPERK